MIGRAKLSLALSVWVIVSTLSGSVDADRWSRQIANSEWIPLANPRNQRDFNQNTAPSPYSQIHQPLIPASLPPELQQEYQQQLIQLQKTQESIQRILLLQQQLKAQQQLLQGQAYLPNGIPESEENKQALHQSAIANVQALPELAPEALIPPQPDGDPRPPVYSQQNFRDQQNENSGQKQYEDFDARQVAEAYRHHERAKETLRDKDKYVPEGVSGPANNDDDGEEEVQVVYVPAETLAQRNQGKNQHHRGRKPHANQATRQRQHHQQRPFNTEQGSAESEAHQQENVGPTASGEEEAYTREFLEQLQREHEGTDRLLKEAREKELERLREERKEIQRRAKLQQAALEREQEAARQREAEKKRKELEKLEEAAKQRELERIREVRERQRQEEIERAKKLARANEEKRKQEDARRQAEIDRLAALERQKKAEIERTIMAQKELERMQKEDEERARQAERAHAARQKEISSQVHNEDTGISSEAQPLIKNQHSHQHHHSQSGKYNRHGRLRNKPRQRGQSNDRNTQETTTTAPLSPNQPPLAVYMTDAYGDSGRSARVTDVLKSLKDAKTIAVLDNVGNDAPHVFVGPSNLEVPTDFAKFDLPYLSSIENNRVERRVDKLPFFVAPLSFNPPAGYSKIPFPAPHVGSVVINNMDQNAPVRQSEEDRKSNLNPLIEPNSFSEDSSSSISYSTNYDSPTTPTYANYHQEQPSSTPQYESSPSYASVEATGSGQAYRFRPTFGTESPSSPGAQEQSRLNYHDQSSPRAPAYPEESQLPVSHHPQSNGESIGSTTPVYRRPNVVSSFAYQERAPSVPSSTPLYQESYPNIHDDSSNRHIHSQVGTANRESGHHQDQVVNRYQLQHQRENDRPQDYISSQVDSSIINRYEDSQRGPTHYNLPPELPPIHPQLPGLVNALLDEREESLTPTGPASLPTTTSTTTTTTTTTQPPITTQKSRGRHRGRIVATRPPTTTPSPSKSRDTDRSRRPFGRTKSRHTTTTEEYQETYEPTKAKHTLTTPVYNHQDNNGRRTVPTKTQKLNKNRDTETSVQSPRNQVQNIQAHEAITERNPNAEFRYPENDGIRSDEPLYPQFNYPSSTTGLENYPVAESDIRAIENPTGAGSYSKNSNYAQVRQPHVAANLKNQEESYQQYDERYPTADFGQSGLEEAPVNGFNYQTKKESTRVTPEIPPTSSDYAYYQNTKQQAFDNSEIPSVSTGSPINSQLTDYSRTTIYENDGDSLHVSHETVPKSHYNDGRETTAEFGPSDPGLYDTSPRDHQDVRTTGLIAEHAPYELTTELPTTTPTTTTTSTTEAAPVIIRQRVRARLGGRGRTDSAVQTRPRGSQDEYVRFSAVNNQRNTPTTERPTTRHRENHRVRSKNRPQTHQNAPVQTEGNDYVRIQAPIRTYQKTIVTQPSSTQRTTTPRTTTQPPTTTTPEYEGSNDELEYGFIRPPNFAPAQPVENRYQHPYRPSENQAELQSIVPIDETAADSIQTHSQVARKRPKYQIPNRRPNSGASTSGASTGPASTSALISDPALYTERPRTRVEEPKNNRIRVKGRKPGKRRTTTTTTTTTEYILEENNNLPLDENYPRTVQTLDELGNGRPGFYDEKYDALHLGPRPTANAGQQSHADDSYSSPDFLLNFGSDADQVPQSESDQTQQANHPSRKYKQPNGSRLRAHPPSNRGNQDRDIYGSESQWSTKLTSTSFQPSPSVNSLGSNEPNEPAPSAPEKEINKYSKDKTSPNEPEIITAPPQDSYVTVLVTSDKLAEESPETSSAESSMEISSMDETNFGMKTSVDGENSSLEKTTPSLSTQDAIAQSSADPTDSTKLVKDYGDSPKDKQSKKRIGVRRRRVRVRVRPAGSEDFVTAESQHFNSAVNNLLQDQRKYHRQDEESRFQVATTESTLSNEHVTPEKNMLDDFLEQVFHDDNKSASSEETTNSEKKSMSEDEKSLTEKPEVQKTNDNQTEDWKMPLKDFQTISNDEGATIAIQDPEMSVESTKHLKDENSTFEKSEKPEMALMTTMTIPRKSWDSTKQYIDYVAMNSGEYSSKKQQSTIDPETASRNEQNDKSADEMFEKTLTTQSDKNEDDNSLGQDFETENYPKNHRTEWSEVLLPTDRQAYNYNRQLNLTGSQELPGIVTKSQGDTSVKTLSDYVKAIFDTMKNADEEKGLEEESTLTTSGSTTHDFPASTVSPALIDGNPESLEATTSSSIDYSTTLASASIPTSNPDIFEYSSTRTVSHLSKTSTEKKSQEEPEKIANLEKSNENVDEKVTKAPENPENTINIDTTSYSEETTSDVPETNSTSTSVATSQEPEVAKSSTTEQPMKTSFSTLAEIFTTEKVPIAKTSMKLGPVLRTSTTTKVSHMTEICYRGRCVMTKPKKEIRSR